MKPVLGFGMIAGALVIVWGGVSGRLAPMLAALFYPDWLTGQTALDHPVTPAPPGLPGAGIGSPNSGSVDTIRPKLPIPIVPFPGGVPILVP